MTLRIRRRPLLLISLLTVAACTPLSTTNSVKDLDDGGPSSGDSSVGTPSGSTGSLSCLGVLTCVGDCPSDANADACAQGCLDRTAPASLPVTQTFATCLTDKNCQDANCIKTQCGTELDACLADDARTQDGTPPSNPAPSPTAGSIPAGLVGLWASGTSSYQFDADGSTTQVFSSTAGEYCTYGTGLTSSGVSSVDGDTLTYHRVEGTLVTTSCGSTTSKPMTAADIVYRYTLGTSSDGQPELTLSLVQSDGTILDPVVMHH